MLTKYITRPLEVIFLVLKYYLYSMRYKIEYTTIKEKKSNFIYNLCNAVNIPKNKENIEIFRSFSSKLCNKNIQRESTLREVISINASERFRQKFVML